MDRPVVIPFRWLGHGLDLRMTVINGRAYFVAADVFLALQIPLSTLPEYELETFLLPGLGEGGGMLDLLTVGQVYEIHDHQPMAFDNGFIDWFSGLVQDHAADDDHLNRLVDGALPLEPGHKSGTTYSVAAAAKILTTDHNLDLGQDRLFRSMSALGWIVRDTTQTWVPSDEPLRAGYLVRRNVRVPQRQGLYPQILVTDAGVLALAQLLAQPETTPDLLEHA